MQLESTRMYTLEIKDLNGNEVTTVTQQGMEINAMYPGLVVGQTVRDYKMFIVVPFGA
uniref:Uncharacterized protein n=1 Tax=Pseudomonas phage RVTF4 TaxID=3236931 RepID=A0AB39CCN8_9VIRU